MKGSNLTPEIRRRAVAASVLSNTRHGMTDTRVWRIWKGILERCRSPSSPNYYNYGGRGIKVCERWLTFENFYFDMGDPPPKMQIDRIDTNGDYTLKNCRWTTARQNANNRRNCRYLTLGDKTMTVTEWSRELGMTPQGIHRRIDVHHWPILVALTKPPRRRIK